MGTPATVGVDDDLTPSKTSISLRSTDDEATGRLNLWRTGRKSTWDHIPQGKNVRDR